MTAPTAVPASWRSGAVGRRREGDGERRRAGGGEPEAKREGGGAGKRHADGPADGPVAPRVSRELAQVELVAGDEEQDAHAQSAEQRKPCRLMDDAQAVRSHDGSRHDEEHDLRYGPARDEARRKRRAHHHGEHRGQYRELFCHVCFPSASLVAPAMVTDRPHPHLSPLIPKFGRRGNRSYHGARKKERSALMGATMTENNARLKAEIDEFVERV